MTYPETPIPASAIPVAVAPAFQHALDIYAGETNKVAAIWSAFTDPDLPWRPDPRSSTVREILRHQLLSERRFFGEFLLLPEPPPETILPAGDHVPAYIHQLIALARPRLDTLAQQPESWWLTTVPFFDVQRQRAWIFWRRVLHTAHHRTQLGVYLRLLQRPVPPTYGPTADVTWQGADPTASIEAARRR